MRTYTLRNKWLFSKAIGSPGIGKFLGIRVKKQERTPVFSVSIDVEVCNTIRMARTHGFHKETNCQLSDEKRESILDARGRLVKGAVEKFLGILNKNKIKPTWAFSGYMLSDLAPRGERHFKTLKDRLLDSGHEIACHSFSHIDFKTSGEKEAESDILQCRKVFRENGLNPITFTFPNNREGFLDILKKHRFSVVRRGLGKNILVLDSPKQECGMTLVPQSFWFSDSLISNRIFDRVLQASVDFGADCHLTLHPRDLLAGGLNPVFDNKIKHFIEAAGKRVSRGEIKNLTMGEMARSSQP